MNETVGHDRKIKTQFPDKATVGVSANDYEQTGYDGGGNVIRLGKSNGRNVILAYNNLDRLLRDFGYPIPLITMDP